MRFSIFLLLSCFFMACSQATDEPEVVSATSPSSTQDSIFREDSLRFIQDSLAANANLTAEEHQEIKSIHPFGFGDISRFEEKGLVGLNLFDEEALTEYLGKTPSFIPDTIMDAQLFDYARLHILNSSKTQLASLHQWSDPGNQIAEIKVRYVERDRRYSQKPEVVNVTQFVSSKGIHLGMRLAEVLDILGEPTKSDRVAMYYCISYQAESDLFYYGNYYFDDNKLEYFEFGIPNP